MTMKDLLSSTEKKSLSRLLASYPQIVAGYIFGSRLKRRANPGSDLDIGVICFRKSKLSPIELELKLEKVFTNFQLDLSLLDLNDDPFLLIQIINGQLIYQKNLKERLELENRILFLYEDYKILKKIDSYYLNQSFKKGVYAYK